MFVLGKPIAGGMPSAVYGFTAEVAERMAAVAQGEHGPFRHGHHAVGQSAALAAMRANLDEVMTDAAYAHMLRAGRRGWRRDCAT